KLIVQKGDYIKVPPHFLIGVWCSGDAWITHGDQYHVTLPYPGVYEKAKQLKKEKGASNLPGSAYPYKGPDGRRIIMLYDRTFIHQAPDRVDVKNALNQMWAILRRAPVVGG